MLRKRTPALRLLILLLCCFAICILFFAAGIAVSLHVSTLQGIAWDRYQERVRIISELLQKQQTENHRQSQDRVITSEEWLKTSQSNSANWTTEMGNAWNDYLKESRPAHLTLFVQLTFVVIPALLLTLLTASVVLFVGGARLRNTLHNAGYDWLSKADAAWLLLILRGRVSQIPSADEFLCLPDSRRNADSIAGFVKLRQLVKKGKA